MDEGLPTVDLGRDFQIAQIMIMLRQGCALSSEDELKCWGKYGVSVYNVHIFYFCLFAMSMIHLYEQDGMSTVN